MYNGGVIVVVCGVALCEEIRCISGGLHQRWCISSSQREERCGEAVASVGTEPRALGGFAGAAPFP